VRPWLVRQQTKLHDGGFLQVTQRLVTAMFATQAPDRILESKLYRTGQNDKKVFDCRPCGRQAAAMSSNFMRRNLGIPHAQGLFLGRHPLAVTSVTLDNIRP
jgi:hypothetical protein